MHHRQNPTVGVTQSVQQPGCGRDDREIRVRSAVGSRISLYLARNLLKLLQKFQVSNLILLTIFVTASHIMLYRLQIWNSTECVLYVMGRYAD